MKNSGRVDQYYYNKNRNRFYEKGRSYDINGSFNWENKNFRGRNKFRDDRNRGKYSTGDRRNLRTETGHMTEAEAGIWITEGDSVGGEETAHIGIEVDPCLGIKVKREDVISVGNQDILQGSVRKRIKVKKGERSTNVTNRRGRRWKLVGIMARYNARESTYG